MITGASHSLQTNLTDALSYYRQQLDAQRLNQTATPKNGEVSQLPSPVPPTPPKSYEVEGELNQIPVSEQIKQAAEERRDLSRAAAVSVESLQHKQDVINTYLNVSNTSSDATANTDNKVSPSEVYQETLQYQQREDLMSALQQASGEGQLGKVIDITV